MLKGKEKRIHEYWVKFQWNRNEENNNKAILKNDQEDFGKYTEKWKHD